MIDRSNTFFDLILNYLRDGNDLYFQDMSHKDLKMLKIELDYYRIITPHEDPWCFDIAKSASAGITFLNDNKTAKYVSDYKNPPHRCMIGNMSLNKFTIKIIDKGVSLWVGFIHDENQFKKTLSDSEFESLPKYLFNCGSGYITGVENGKSNTVPSIAVKNGDCLRFFLNLFFIYLFPLIRLYLFP